MKQTMHNAGAKFSQLVGYGLSITCIHCMQTKNMDFNLDTLGFNNIDLGTA